MQECEVCGGKVEDPFTVGISLGFVQLNLLRIGNKETPLVINVWFIKNLEVLR